MADSVFSKLILLCFYSWGSGLHVLDTTSKVKDVWVSMTDTPEKWDAKSKDKMALTNLDAGTWSSTCTAGRCLRCCAGIEGLQFLAYSHNQSDKASYLIQLLAFAQCHLTNCLQTDNVKAYIYQYTACARDVIKGFGEGALYLLILFHGAWPCITASPIKGMNAFLQHEKSLNPDHPGSLTDLYQTNQIKLVIKQEDDPPHIPDWSMTV